jgi:hypothetical protein
MASPPNPKLVDIPEQAVPRLPTPPPSPRVPAFLRMTPARGISPARQAQLKGEVEQQRRRAKREAKKSPLRQEVDGRWSLKEARKKAKEREQLVENWEKYATLTENQFRRVFKFKDGSDDIGEEADENEQMEDLAEKILSNPTPPLRRRGSMEWDNEDRRGSLSMKRSVSRRGRSMARDERDRRVALSLERPALVHGWPIEREVKDRREALPMERSVSQHGSPIEREDKDKREALSVERPGSRHGWPMERDHKDRQEALSMQRPVSRHGPPRSDALRDERPPSRHGWPIEREHEDKPEALSMQRSVSRNRPPRSEAASSEWPSSRRGRSMELSESSRERDDSLGRPCRSRSPEYIVPLEQRLRTIHEVHRTLFVSEVLPKEDIVLLVRSLQELSSVIFNVVRSTNIETENCIKALAMRDIIDLIYIPDQGRLPGPGPQTCWNWITMILDEARNDLRSLRDRDTRVERGMALVTEPLDLHMTKETRFHIYKRSKYMPLHVNLCWGKVCWGEPDTKTIRNEDEED